MIIDRKIAENFNAAETILDWLQTQSSRIFPGSYAKPKNLGFHGIPGLERKIPKFKEFQEFQVAYEPW